MLEKPFEGSKEVQFAVSPLLYAVYQWRLMRMLIDQKCVLATGALQPAPMRAELGSSMADMQTVLRKMQTEIAQAKKVVVIGGGPVGVEFAGVSLFADLIYA